MPSFNAVVFEEQVRAAVDGRVMGYSFVIADRDGIEAKVSGGFAQAPDDGDVAMKTFLPSNVGSIAKMMTGVALLHLAERQQLANASVAAQLERPMMDYVPVRWRTEYGDDDLDAITLRNLLNHRSGLGPEVSGSASAACGHGTKIACSLSRGADPRLRGQDAFAYNNNNYTLLLYVIPSIAFPTEVAEVERDARDLPLDEYNRAMAGGYGALYERYMREQFLRRTVESISPTCRPGDELRSDRFAKEYASRTDRAGSVVNPSFCRSQGSWFYSAQDLAQFARTLEFTERFVSPATRAMMFDPARLNERLVYNKVIREDGFQPTAGQALFPLHGGTSENNGDGSRATLIRLPYGYVGVGAVNSRELTSDALTQIVVDAFMAATQRPEPRTHHGLTVAQYQQLVEEFSGTHYPSWVDFYTVSGQTFANLILLPPQGEWIARHGLTHAELVRLLRHRVDGGPFAIRQIDAYRDGDRVRYAIVLVRSPATRQRRYLNADLATHNARFREYVDDGYVPVAVAPVSVDGQARFAAVYERRSVGGLWHKSLMDTAEFTEAVRERRARGQEVAYVNTWHHDGKIRYATVFYGDVDRQQRVDQGMGPLRYQATFDEHTGAGFSLRLVTGAGSRGRHRYTAVWER